MTHNISMKAVYMITNKNKQFNQNNNTENLTYSTCIYNLTFKIQDNQYQSNE